MGSIGFNGAMAGFGTYAGDHTFNIHQLNDLHYAITDKISGAESMGEMAQLGFLDKLVTLAKENAKIQEEIAWARQEQARRMQKQHKERRQRFIANGWLFS